MSDLSYRNSENVGNTALDRKAIFDLYCQNERGDRFIVEIQKAKQNFFKDRSVYYSTFPIQEQALNDLNNAVNTSRQEGREEGLDEGATRVVVRLLEKRFGPLSDDTLRAIRSLAVEESAALSEAQVDFDSRSDLETWLASRANR